MRGFLAALTVLLLAPSVVGAPAVVSQGEMDLFCAGVTYRDLEGRPGSVGLQCGKIAYLDPAGPTGAYEATVSWEAAPGYETLEACFGSWRSVVKAGATEYSERISHVCVHGGSPLSVAIPAGADVADLDLVVSVVTPNEAVHLWLPPRTHQPVSFVVTHDPDA